MAILTGKIRTEQLIGEIKELSGLKAKISPVRTLDVEISQAPQKYSGKWVGGVSFGGAVNVLNVLYRFITAKVCLLLGIKAKASTAPATLAESETVIQASKEAPLAAHPAADATVNNGEKLSVFAQLAAYVRAACVYIKNVFMGCTANMISAVGAVAKYRKWMQLESTYKAESADSSIMECRFNSFTDEVEAVASSAPAVDTAAVETEFTAESTATVIPAGVVYASIQTEPETAHAAKMATWIYPEVVNGVLYLRQAYSATVENDVLVVR